MCRKHHDGEYNQICMHSDNQEKTTFVIEPGVFVTVVIMFGLKMTPATFQCIIAEIFEDYIPTFMQVFLSDFAIYGRQIEHLAQLRLCLEHCRQAGLSLNRLWNPPISHNHSMGLSMLSTWLSKTL